MIGGIVAAGVAGAQRVSNGSARDHLLGFRAVSGRGETFVAGAKAIKNVTGHDLPNLSANSWGRLFAMTELTLKVLPALQVRATRTIAGWTSGRQSAPWRCRWDRQRRWLRRRTCRASDH